MGTVLSSIAFGLLRQNQMITTHPDVKDTAVMPIKSAIHQHIPICAVVLTPKSQLNENELLNRQSTFGSRGPKRVLTLDSVPRNEQGKLIRQELTDKLKRKLSS